LGGAKVIIASVTNADAMIADSQERSGSVGLLACGR